jgi:hypothetical protein
MKRPCLVVATLVAVLLTAAVLGRSGWLGRRTSSGFPRRLHPDDRARACDLVTSPAGWHYRHSQPTHWRGCLLQH